MRKILIIAGILIGGVALAAGALLLLVDVNQLRPQIEAQLQKRLERPVTLGDIGLKLFPLSVRVENFSVGEGPSFRSTRPFVSAKEIGIRAGLMPLLRKQLEISSLVLREPSIELIKNQQGIWNYSTLGGKSSGEGGQSMKLEHLEVIDGTIAMTNLQSGEPRAVYEHIDVIADMPDDAMTAGLSLKAFGGEISAKLSATGFGTPSAAITGSGAVTNLSLPLAGFSKPLVVKTASFALAPDELKLSNLESSLAGSTLKGNATAKNFSAPHLQFNADIDQLDAGEIQKLMVPSKSAGSQQSGGGLRNVTGNGTLNIGALRYNTLSMNHVKATCTLDRGLIRLTPVQSELSGGSQAGNITIDTRPQYPTFAVSTKLQKVDANQLLSAATSLKQVIYGLLAGDAETRFVSRPGEDIAKSLNGQISLELTNGKLQGASLLNEMAVLGKFLGAVKRSEAFTTIVNLTGTFKIDDGVATTDDLRLDFGGGMAGAAGTINLVDQTLNLRLNTVFGKELSQRAGGTQVGGFMTTALSNPKGELVIPAIVSGTFSNPRFAPDVQRFAQMKLRSLLPSSDDPAGGQGLAGGMRGIVDALRGKKEQPAEPAAEGAPKPRPVDSLLDLFRKKKEPAPPPK